MTAISLYLLHFYYHFATCDIQNYGDVVSRSRLSTDLHFVIFKIYSPYVFLCLE